VRTILATLFAVIGAVAPSLALADELDGPEARLAWSMGFGGAGETDGYSLTLAYRDEGAHTVRVADWQVAGDVGVARLMGMPIVARNYKTQQMDDPIAYGSSPLNWAWWVASGVVVTVLVMNAVDDDDEPVSGTGSGS
jgi:hypothetical protein